MFLLAIVALAVYFVPIMVASNRNHPNATAIFFLNLLLGWTFLGWVASLVWAFSGPQGEPATPLPANAVRTTKTCPKCAEEVKAAATVCRFCGFDFTSAPTAATQP